MANVLIVEDEALMARTYKMAFTLGGHQAILASDGLKGLESLKSQIPDIILLDLMMPNMDGVQFLDEIKSKPETQNIPVVVLTSLAGERHIKQALSKGAIKHIDKSRVEPREVVKIVEKILSGNGNEES